jgi:hypothetical protein
MAAYASATPSAVVIDVGIISDRGWSSGRSQRRKQLGTLWLRRVGSLCRPARSRCTIGLIPLLKSQGMTSYAAPFLDIMQQLGALPTDR